ncbi:hypothetical protein M514_19298 [Trichuris suis]|uniref:Uncharacterized protein n=1 Tax=Trichuris suis TaxID=68888 RepID=A0A085NG76_9BILA|nr:hypothetical protein M514_19298 [Trichuris suis]
MLRFLERGKPERQVPPRFELGLLDSKSRVLTVTLWNQAKSLQAHGKSITLETRLSEVTVAGVWPTV